MVSRVVIAGGGVGGLTLAIALKRRGVHVTVLERASQLGPAGAGLALQPNAIKALSHLGLSAAVTAAGAPIGRAGILDWRGRALGADTDIAALGEEFGTAVALHRARLHEVLLDAVGPGVVTAGVAVVSYDATANSVVVRGSNGAQLEAELLVGADGLHSAVRRQLLGDGEPVYSGYTSWRGVTPAGSVPPPTRVIESWGRGERFGIVNIGFGEIYWFAVADAPSGGRDHDVCRELLRRFGGWHDPVRALIEATPAARIVRTDICDRLPVARWHAGRVVLVGDAAHPMTPNLGQGAGQAIEDAVVLDQCLAASHDIESALTSYEQRRVHRANAIVRGSRQFGEIAQWSHPVAALLRDTAMRLVPAWVKLRQLRQMMLADL